MKFINPIQLFLVDLFYICNKNINRDDYFYKQRIIKPNELSNEQK